MQLETAVKEIGFESIVTFRNSLSAHGSLSRYCAAARWHFNALIWVLFHLRNFKCKTNFTIAFNLICGFPFPSKSRSSKLSRANAEKNCTSCENCEVGGIWKSIRTVLVVKLCRTRHDRVVSSEVIHISAVHSRRALRSSLVRLFVSTRHAST